MGWNAVRSVTMPSVPSAPTKSFVTSQPADDLRERRLVLITSPEGKTIVCEASAIGQEGVHGSGLSIHVRTAFKNHSPRAVPYRTAFASQSQRAQYNAAASSSLPEQPVLNMPPRVAVGAGSS